MQINNLNSIFSLRSVIDCSCFSSTNGLNTWVYMREQKTCQLGTLTHTLLAQDETTGINAGVPIDLPMAGETLLPSANWLVVYGCRHDFYLREKKDGLKK